MPPYKQARGPFKAGPIRVSQYRFDFVSTNSFLMQSQCQTHMSLQALVSL